MKSERVGETAALAALVVLLLAGTLGRAITRPLWHDEIFTLYIATLPSMNAVWGALARAVDLNPPLYHVSVHGVAGALGAGALATRLPAVLGYLLATLSLYAFCRRRMRAPFAWVAAVLPAFGAAYAYAYEGRPYGLVLAWAALALLAWQARTHPRWTSLAPAACAVALALAFFTHYYTVLLLLPLGAGELTRVWRTRRVDWPMWTGLALSLAPFAILLPLVRAAREFAGTFWSPPAIGDLVSFYIDLLDPLAIVLIVALAAAAFAGLAFRRRPAYAAAHGPWPFPADESVALLALLAVPGVAFIAAVLVTGAFHPRYVLYAVLAAAALGGGVIASTIRGRPLRACVAVIALAFAARQAGGVMSLRRTPPDPIARDRAVLAQVPEGATVVVSHALTFVPLAYYGGESLHDDILYLARPPEVVRALGVDTGSRALQRLAEIAPLRVVAFEAFTSRRAEFYVYGPQSWLMPHLLQRGATAELLALAGDRSLYRVKGVDQRELTQYR